MSRIAWMLMGGLAALAIQATSSADERGVVELFVSGHDCRKGTIERRLDCLTLQVEHIQARLDGRFGEVVPLATPAPVTPPVRPAPVTPPVLPQQK